MACHGAEDLKYCMISWVGTDAPRTAFTFLVVVLVIVLLSHLAVVVYFVVVCYQWSRLIQAATEVPCDFVVSPNLSGYVLLSLADKLVGISCNGNNVL